jgi:competence protein ComEA
MKFPRSQPIEITTQPRQEIQGEVYISGAVNNPGVYPLKPGDTLDDLMRAAGGASAAADRQRLELYAPEIDGAESPQQVDLNRAELWLLQALPGIGEVRAQAIVTYREQNGRFRHTSELTRVDGIGTATYEKIKHLITVGD